MTSDEILGLSAIALAKKISEGRLTSHAVVDAHIEAAKSVNQHINAIVVPRYEQALAEAKQVDKQIRNKTLPKSAILAGVPCTIKEQFAMAGMPHTGGLLARKSVVAMNNATTVERLRSAGAIPIGTTNTSELSLWMESANPLYGRSRNPYNTKHMVGGSSGGEGAIVGSGASPFGLGADIGGSIRIPAFCNGVFGHKSTGGHIPNTGQYPLPSDAAMSYLVAGPICRKSEDLFPILKILAGPDGIDPACSRQNLVDPKSVDAKKIVFHSIRGNGREFVSKTLKKSQLDVEKRLQECGYKINNPSSKLLQHSFAIWVSMMGLAQEKGVDELLGQGTRISPTLEILKWFVQHSQHTLPPLLMAFSEKLGRSFPGLIRRFAAMGDELRKTLEDMLGDDGVLLYPSYSTCVPKHNRTLLMPTSWVYTGIFNVLTFPATQIPLGLAPSGLPLGIQAVAAPHQDHLTLATANLLEEMFGGWVPPKKLD